jgi:hypothetical protein
MVDPAPALEPFEFSNIVKSKELLGKTADRGLERREIGDLTLERSAQRSDFLEHRVGAFNGRGWRGQQIKDGHQRAGATSGQTHICSCHKACSEKGTRTLVGCLLISVQPQLDSNRHIATPAILDRTPMISKTICQRE